MPPLPMYGKRPVVLLTVRQQITFTEALADAFPHAER